MKIAPFRIYSRGYSGQVRIPIRKLEFSADVLAEV